MRGAAIEMSQTIFKSDTKGGEASPLAVAHPLEADEDIPTANTVPVRPSDPLKQKPPEVPERRRRWRDIFVCVALLIIQGAVVVAVGLAVLPFPSTAPDPHSHGTASLIPSPTGSPTPAPTTAPHPMPTSPLTTAPHPWPTSPPTATYSPTAANEVVVYFSLYYYLALHEKSFAYRDLRVLEEETSRYLKEVLLLHYDFDHQTNLESFRFSAVFHNDNNAQQLILYEGSMVDAVKIDCKAFVAFTGTVPEDSVVQAQVRGGFQGEQKVIYLSHLHSVIGALSSAQGVRYVKGQAPLP